MQEGCQALKEYFKKYRIQFFYLVGGGSATLLDIFLLWIFHTKLWINMYISALIAFFITVVYGYLFHRYITYAHTPYKSHLEQFLQFVVVNVFTQIMYMVFLYVWTTFTDLFYILIAVFAKIVTFVINYVLHTFVTFRKKKYVRRIIIILLVGICVWVVRYREYVWVSI